MLYREINKTSKYGLDGQAVLKVLMNTNIAFLDLLVRESIQNSLDASDSTSNDVRVDFTTGKFDVGSFVSLIGDTDSIANTILAEYRRKKICDSFIAIRDTNTVGLLGDDSDCGEKKRSEMGNLGKLVYNIGMNQNGAGKGGAYGYGKTTYYRLGIGMVVYYSRTFENGKYESKLVIGLIENASLKNSLFAKSGIDSESGIAWWGRDYNGYAAPVKEERMISDFISLFGGVRPFSEKETGTIVIIPFFNDNAHLKDARTQYKDDVENPQLYYTKTVDNFLEYSIQKWYFPRFSGNKSCYKGKKLSAYINDEKVHLSGFFKECKNLYNCAVLCKSDEDEKTTSTAIDLKAKGSEKSFSGSAGVLSMKLLDPDFDAEAVLDPYILLFGNVESNSEKKPLFMFTRKPGMIVNYHQGGDGCGWLKGVPSHDAKIPVSIFVSSESKMNKEGLINGHVISTIEDYFRSCELAIHNDWNDAPQYQIVSKVKSNVAIKLGSMIDPKQDNGNGSFNKRISRTLANLFLPQGLGNDTTYIAKPGRSVETPKKLKNKDYLFSITGSQVFEKDIIGFPFELQLRAGKNVRIEFCIGSETGMISSTEWYNVFPESSFPCEITKIDFRKKGRSNSIAKYCTCTISQKICCNNDFGVDSISFDSRSSFIVGAKEEVYITGYIFYKVSGTWAVTIRTE